MSENTGITPQWQREAFAGLPYEQQPTIAEAYGGEVRYADSTINNIGGHTLHVEGGADLMWRQVGHLTMALREMCAEVDRLRAHRCRACGEPAAVVFRPGDSSPFLKTVIGEA